MPLCDKCNQSRPPRGFYMHYKHCKGSLKPINTDVKDKPESSLYPKEKIKEIIDKPEKFKVDNQEKENDFIDEIEEYPEDYADKQINPLWYILVIIPVSIILAIYYFIVKKNKEE